MKFGPKTGHSQCQQTELSLRWIIHTCLLGGFLLRGVHALFVLYLGSASAPPPAHRHTHLVSFTDQTLSVTLTNSAVRHNTCPLETFQSNTE